MAKAQQGGQASFEDVVLTDEDLGEQIRKYLDTRAAMSDHRAADREIKKLVPHIEKPTRFLVGEDFFIEASPFSRDGHNVRGSKGQRLRIKETVETSA